MILESTTDFVLHLRSSTHTELSNSFPGHFHDRCFNASQYVANSITNDAILWKFAGNHAKFVSKTLRKGFFVPCNYDDVFLEEPYFDGKNNEDYVTAKDAYEKSKNRILFKGFKTKYFKLEGTWQNLIVSNDEVYYVDNYLFNSPGFSIKFLLDLDIKFELTNTGINEIII